MDALASHPAVAGAATPMPSSARSLSTAIAALIAIAIGIVLSYLIHWFPASGLHAGAQHRPALPRARDRLDPDLRAGRDGDPVLASGSSACGPARSSRTARRSTATRAWRSSGRRSRAAPARARRLLLRRAARQREEARAARSRSASPASSSPGPTSTRPSVTGGAPLNSYQLYVPKGESVDFDMRSQGRDPRLLDPRLPPAGGRRARHHHPLPRDARPPRHLPGRLQPALRRSATR